jgi:nitrite reductase/ring-hydroxylating ferredoxin subunit
MDAEKIINAILESDDEFDSKAFIQAHGKQLEEPSRKHLFVSSADGGLYDTRNKDWHKGPPLRQNFQQFHTRIFNIKDFKATWRARHNSNYPLAFILSDGAAMCEKCVADNLRQIIDSTRQRHNDGWQVVGVSQCHGDPEEEADYHTQCAQCNKNLGELG